MFYRNVFLHLWTFQNILNCSNKLNCSKTFPKVFTFNFRNILKCFNDNFKKIFHNFHFYLGTNSVVLNISQSFTLFFKHIEMFYRNVFHTFLNISKCFSDVSKQFKLFQYFPRTIYNVLNISHNCQIFLGTN